MRFEIGHRVAVLDDTLKGTIVNIDGELIGVQDDDGMIYDYKADQLVLIEKEQYQLTKYSDIDHPLLKDKMNLSIRKRQNFIKEKKITVLEVDLHINQLVKSTKGMDNYDMLSLQIAVAKKKLDFAVSKRISKIIFIHGVGEGILKKELYYLLEKYPVSYYDASYQKYGLGATEVYVYQNSKS